MLFKLWITSYFASNHNNNETCGLNHVIMAHWQGFSVGNSALEPLTSGSAFYHKYFRLLWFHEKPFEYPLKVLMCIGFLFQFGLKLFGNWQKKKSLSEFTVQHSFPVYLYLFYLLCLCPILSLSPLMIMQKPYTYSFFQGSAFSTSNPAVGVLSTR